MSIIRIKKEAQYFAASNIPFNDIRLSWEARGLMGYLLSKPNDWIVRRENLIKQGPAGLHKIKGMLRELNEYGYLRRIRCKREDGTFFYETEIYEDYRMNPDFTAGRLSTSSSSTNSSATNGKPHHLINTDLTSTELIITESVNHELEETPPANAFSVYENNIGVLTPVISDLISSALDDYSEAWIIEAIHEAVRHNARNWSYVEAILRRWSRDGFKSDSRKNNGRKSAGKKPARASDEEIQRREEEISRQQAEMSRAVEEAKAQHGRR